MDLAIKHPLHLAQLCKWKFSGRIKEKIMGWDALGGVSDEVFQDLYYDFYTIGLRDKEDQPRRMPYA